jgi:hypothetical protein
VTFTWERAENKAYVLKSRFCWERYLLVVTKLWTSLGKEIVRSDINPFVQEEGLTVDKASRKRPDDVRDALLVAPRQVGQHSWLLIEVKLLHLELIIHDMLAGCGH